MNNRINQKKLMENKARHDEVNKRLLDVSKSNPDKIYDILNSSKKGKTSVQIKEGMVLSIEPWVYESLKIEGGTGKYGIQNQFEVTKNGCRKINALRRDIIQVSHPIKK